MNNKEKEPDTVPAKITKTNGDHHARPPSTSKSTGELIACLNALNVLGPVERVTERRLERLLAARPDLEPARIAKRRAFGPAQESAIRAAFEARRKQNEKREAAKVASKAARAG